MAVDFKYLNDSRDILSVRVGENSIIFLSWEV